MTLEMIKLSDIKPTKNNPRKSQDQTSIEGLAESIRTDGLLQNLVVSKPNGKSSYNLVSGERRFRALQLLIKQGELPKDVQVPAEVRKNLSNNDALRIATIENLQREDMHPLEESEAIIKMMQSGMDSKELSAQTGISQSTIKRRLCFANLSPEIRELFSKGEISISQSEALSMGTFEEQNDLIQQLDYMDAEDIKIRLTNDKMPMSKAIFDLKNYNGTYSSDLFSDEETTYFDDISQFWILQKDAAEMLVPNLENEGYDPVKFIEGGYFENWKYQETPEDEIGGAIVFLDSQGNVKSYKGIIERVEIKPEKEKKTRASYSAPLREYVAMHKSLAVQSALLDNPRIAKEVAIVQMMSGMGVRLDRHKSLTYFDADTVPNSHKRLSEIFKEFANDLGLGEDQDISNFLYNYFVREDSENYLSLKHQTDEVLDKLHLYLSTICFGQRYTKELDSHSESIFNLVAADLKVDMREHWTPDEGFFNRRTNNQLEEIVKESGLTSRMNTSKGGKKAEKVKSLIKHFSRIKGLEKPKKGELKAHNWLPGVFEFPAINPDIE